MNFLYKTVEIFFLSAKLKTRLCNKNLNKFFWLLMIWNIIFPEKRIVDVQSHLTVWKSRNARKQFLFDKNVSTRSLIIDSCLWKHTKNIVGAIELASQSHSES